MGAAPDRARSLVQRRHSSLEGYGIIERFSEDLDLMVQHGSAFGLPPVANWTSTNKGPVAARRAFHGALPNAFVIPGVKVEVDQKPQDKYARSINLVGRYPGERKSSA